jgi:hypothetical protein
MTQTNTFNNCLLLLLFFLCTSFPDNLEGTGMLSGLSRDWNQICEERDTDSKSVRGYETWRENPHHSQENMDPVLTTWQLQFRQLSPTK